MFTISYHLKMLFIMGQQFTYLNKAISNLNITFNAVGNARILKQRIRKMAPETHYKIIKNSKRIKKRKRG